MFKVENKFIHLRILTSYSLLYSSNTIEKLFNVATQKNIKILPITDKNNLFGSLEFSLNAKKNNIIPIIGALVPLDLKETEVLLLAKSEKGYSNLIKLVSYYYQNKKHISIETLSLYNEDIIILSGYTLGPIGYAIKQNNIKKAIYYTEQLKIIFKDRFYYEIMRHNLTDEIEIEKTYIDLSLKYDIPLVATNNVLFCFNSDDLHKNTYEAHDTLLCIANNNKKIEKNRITSSPEYYLKNEEDMIELFKDIPNAIQNTIEIAKRCAFGLTKKQPILPKYAKNENLILKNQSFEGLFQRLQTDRFANKDNHFIFDTTKKHTLIQKKEIIKKYYKNYYDQIEYELKVICNMGFAGYFLIVSDFIKWAKKQNIFVGPGRGSGAGSIVAWSLQITNLNPLEYNLIFERFLNPERISVADFDIDFCQERRHEVIEYIKQKYGNENVGQIITFGILKPKAAIKDICRVYNLPFNISNYLSNLIPINQVSQPSLQESILKIKELNNAFNGKGLYKNQEFNAKIQIILQEALLLENIHRHVSIHAAGIVISPTPLIETIALFQNDDSSTNIIQYSMKYAEMIGFVKFDLLGLQTLTVLDKSIKNIKISQNKQIDLNTIPYDEQKVFDLLSSGKSRGIFQFESSGIQSEIVKFKPNSILDIMALTSLYRPGPLENLPSYISRKNGEEEVTYLHVNAKNILNSTYGILIYQEQVLELAKQLAGYSLGSADILRKAMGKKNPLEMKKQEEIFIDGCEKNNISREKSKEIFKYISTFAGYGFNKAHAASYALIAYYTAYLKTFYLTEFLISAMNLEINDRDRICLFCHECKANNISIDPLSINDIELLFAIQGKNRISYSLLAIKGMPSSGAELIIEERNNNGSFNSLQDFIDRCYLQLNKKCLESLILSGCLDTFNHNRKTLFNSVDNIISYINSIKNKESNIEQLSLLSNINFINIKKTNEFTLQELLENEFIYLSTFITSHPTSIYSKHMNTYKIKNSKELNSITKQKILIMGFIEYRINKISKGKQYSWLRISDFHGEMFVSIFKEEIHALYGELLKEKQTVILEVENTNNTISILRAFPIERLNHKIMQNIDLYIKNNFQLTEIMDILLHTIVKNNEYTKINLYISTENNFKIKLNLRYTFKLSLEQYNILVKYQH